MLKIPSRHHRRGEVHSVFFFEKGHCKEWKGKHLDRPIQRLCSFSFVCCFFSFFVPPPPRSPEVKSKSARDGDVLSWKRVIDEAKPSFYRFVNMPVPFRLRLSLISQLLFKINENWRYIHELFFIYEYYSAHCRDKLYRFLFFHVFSSFCAARLR